MIRNLSSKTIISILLFLINITVFGQQKIVFTWNATQDAEQKFGVFATSGINVILVKWGDGSEEYYNGFGIYPIDLKHTYSNSNNYEVNIEATNQNINLLAVRFIEIELTSLDVSNAPELTEIMCYTNNLTSLDVSANLKLTHLLCHENQLTSLDISANTALEFLSCWSNNLTSLDISENISLTTLHCYDNLISMSGIKDISDNFSGIAYIGTQTLIEIPYSEENDAYTFDDAFNGAGTLFEVILNDVEAIENEDYVIAGGDITFLKQGMYIVTVSNSYIISASEHPAKVTASINIYWGIDDKDEPKLYIYPNPVKNKFYVDNNVDEQQIIIYNIQGKTVLKTRNSEVDISDLDSGIYFVNIGKQSFKVIKE
ncbi:MAG: T9SS type A sorting domain-containing protein [Bacteroidales bacterium]|jgi:hypothetical protein|nr:T9SS type A sorting domain-containing protein [Bacteroidales bacterium]